MADRLFLDANVLFTAAHRPEGKAAFLLQAWPPQAVAPWYLLSSAYALEEARRNLTVKFPDALARWQDRDGAERSRGRTEQSFCVAKAEIAANDYDLSINRYKEVVHDEVEHKSPQAILAELSALEAEIQQGLSELKAMLQ